MRDLFDFQSRTNVSMVSTFCFHAISAGIKPKTIGRASRHQIPSDLVQRLTVSLYFWYEVSSWFSIPERQHIPSTDFADGERKATISQHDQSTHEELGT